MNFRHLQSFVDVAEHGSLARAGVASDVAQSLMSRHIAALESAWGDRLFERTGRGMTLSEFGLRMLPEVRAALEQAARLEALARESAGVPTGTVHVGVLPSLAPQLLPRLFTDLRSTAPGVTLRAIEGFSGNLDEQLASGRLDIAVINRYGQARLVGEDALGKADTYLIGRADSPLLAQDSLPFKSLSGIPLVLPAIPNGLRFILNQLARRQGVRLNIAMEVDNSGSMKDVALSGEAYTLLPLMAVREDLAKGTLAAVPLVKPAIRRAVVLASTNSRPLSRAVRHVISRIRLIAPSLIQ